MLLLHDLAASTRGLFSLKVGLQAVERCSSLPETSSVCVCVCVDMLVLGFSSLHSPTALSDSETGLPMLGVFPQNWGFERDSGDLGFYF